MGVDENTTTIVCVTGASGMIGLRITELLVGAGYIVRVLTRKNSFPLASVECFTGGLDDEAVLASMLTNAKVVFHCAAELYDEDKMYAVNVKGSELLAQLIIEKNVDNFVYISSAGVVGPTSDAWVDENTPCHPSNPYEVSKWQAEQALMQLNKENMRLCILRPINVIDDDRPGIIGLAQQDNIKNSFAIFIKGGEVAHVVHALDVAAAAIHLATVHLIPTGIFFVGCDEDSRNTVSGLVKLYKQVCGIKNVKVTYLHVAVSSCLRSLIRGQSLHGASRFSSKKLKSTGFEYLLGLERAVERVAMKTREE